MPVRPLFAEIVPDVPAAASILEAISLPVLVVSASGIIVYANGSAIRDFGHALAGLLLDVLLPHATDALPPCGASREVLDREGRAWEARFTPVDAGHHAVTLRGVSARSEQLERDRLTGLATRDGLSRMLEQMIPEQDGARLPIAVHCFSLDRFRIVNDSLSHAVGDLLLQKVAERLSHACRKQEVIARSGGDEFIILQKDVGKPAEAERMAARLIDLIGRTYVLKGHTINIGISCGVALHEAGLSARDLLRNGALALQDAKRAGGSRYRVFEEAMNQALRARRELEIDIRRALALRQFELHYQPFLDVETNRIRGFEALIRWNHPVRGRVSPLDFIPLAEETGLIGAIGEWVMRTACREAAGWPDGMTVAVNVSPVQFKAEGLLAMITSALAHSGLEPHRLEVEVTESLLLDNTDRILQSLHALRDLGVKIAMDDFGTGYSSLSYLQKFPFNKIKIDRSFVQAAHQGADSEAILKAIGNLGCNLGMLITAEGVETTEQLTLIRDNHCTHVQGYLTGKPMPADAIQDFIDIKSREPFHV